MSNSGYSKSQARIEIMGLYLIAFLLLTFALKTYIVGIYGYAGFEWYPSKLKMGEAVALLLIICATCPVRMRQPSDFLLHFQILFPILPMLVIYGASDLSRPLIYLVVIAYLVSDSIVIWAKLKFPLFRAVYPKSLMYVLSFLTCSIIVSIVGFGGLSYWNTSLFEVYSYRSASAGNLPSIFGYLSPLASKVLIPAAFLIAVLYGNRLLAAITLFLCFTLFALTAHKDILVYPVAVFLIYKAMSLKKPQVVLLVVYCSIIFVSFFTTSLFSSADLVGNLLVRRMMFLPAQITFWYHEFFSEYEFMLWSQSKISMGLIEPPYQLQGAQLIGLHKYKVETANLNTGWLGSGYMNAGALGVLIYAVILGVIMSILNTVAKLIDIRVVFAISFPSFMTAVVSSDLPTALFNHGILASLIMFMLIDPGSMSSRRIQRV